MSVEVPPDDASLLQTIYVVSSSLSLFGASLIIFSYLSVKELRRFPYTLVFWLSVCDFLFALKFLFSGIFNLEYAEADEWVCVLQAAWAQAFGLASVSWNGIISLNVILELRNPFSRPQSFHLVYHVYVWAISMATTCLMLGLKQYGQSDAGTCWLKEGWAPWVLFFTPLLAYFIFAGFALVFALLRTRYMLNDDRIRWNMIKRMVVYSVVFVGVWSWPLIHRICVMAGYNATWLIAMDAMGVGGQGLANAVVWLSNPFFLSKLTRTSLFVTITYCFQRRREDDALVEEEEDESHLAIADSLRTHAVLTILRGLRKSVLDRRQDDETRKVETGDFERFEYSIKNKGLEGSSGSLRFKNVPIIIFVDFAPYVFHQIRGLSGLDVEDYLASLAPQNFLESLRKQRFSEGRSGSFFVFSSDRRFIIKTIAASEALLLRRILPFYYEYLMDNRNSLLVRFYGLHTLHTPDGFDLHVIIMNNIFQTTNRIHQRYDLKGSWVRREVGAAHHEDPSILGMDLDFQRSHGKMYVGARQKEMISQQIENDVQFLCKRKIIDYSLLVGIHYVSGMEETSHGREKSRFSRLRAMSQKVSNIIKSATRESEEEEDDPERRVYNSSNNVSVETKDKARDQTTNGREHQPAVVQRSPSIDDDSTLFETTTSSVSVDLNASLMSEEVFVVVDPRSPDTDEETLRGEEVEWKPDEKECESVTDGSDGGIVSKDGELIYYIGVIDMLQLYDCGKQSERVWKVYVRRVDEQGVSVQPAGAYRDRFARFIKSILE